MSKSLPERPDLAQLRKQAKDLLRDVRAGVAAAAARVSENERTGLTLAGAQRIVAREFGFASWAKLKLHVESRGAAQAADALLQFAINGAAEQVRSLLRERPELARASIHAAAALGEAAEVSAWLRRNPALVSAPGGSGRWSPLLFACLGRVGGDDAARAECVRRLLAAGANANEHWIDEAFPDSKLPALYAATGENDYPQVARALLAAGANPNDGESAYHAAEHAHVASLEVLHEFHADFSHSVPPGGNTPLYFLFEVIGGGPHREAGARWLLQHGADPNVVTRDLGETALHAAVRRGCSSAMIRDLLDHGADPARRRADGRTPLALAVRGGHEEIAAILRGSGRAPEEVGDIDRFLGACLRADGRAARTLLAARPDLMRALADDDRRLVFEAAREDRGAALTLMAELGFDLQLAGTEGETPLHVAGWCGQAEAVRALVRAGVDLDVAETRFGAPPIGWVAHGSQFNGDARGDHPGCAAALIEAGAKVPPHTRASPEVMAVIRRMGRG